MAPDHIDLDETLAHLTKYGYVVLREVLSAAELQELRDTFDTLMAHERRSPFEPGDGPALASDADVERFLRESYTVSKAELSRLMRRIRYTRAQSHATPWPVPPNEVNKCFLHLPTLFDQDRSQRVWNLLNKGDVFARLVEHPTVLALVRHILGTECVLSDCSATSIGPHTEGGSWHVDVPLGQLPEPLPDFPLTTQNAWMLDDFTERNGATRVVPGSHLLRKKPPWGGQSVADEIILTAPAGSVAIWLSNTWHRSGPNAIDRPRRAVLGYYSRSWVKPFTDFAASVDADRVARYSPTVRYLIGFGSNALVRG